MDDDFERLGIGPEATTEEIKAAFRRRARQMHPDTRSGARPGSPSGGRTGEPPGGPASTGDEEFVKLAEARRRVLALHGLRSATQAQGREGSAATVPAQRRRTAPRPAPGAPPRKAAGASLGATPARADDPMVTLLTLPQRCTGPWPTAALELWALTVVPAARTHLAAARSTAVDAGASLARHRTAATAHVLITMTLTGRRGRRIAALAPHVPSAYAVLERELPPTVVGRLPGRVVAVHRDHRTTVIAACAGAVAGGLAVWVELPGRLWG